MITGMPRIAIASADLPNMVTTFRDKLGLPVVELKDLPAVKTFGANLGMCVPIGGSNIELMAPGDLTLPLSQSLQGFIDRRGEGLFALMLEAAVPDEEAELLAGRGLQVLPTMADAFGRDVHPATTHGVLIRVYPIDSFEGHYPEPYDDPNPTRLTGIQKVIIAVKDINAGSDTYGVKFGMPVSEPVSDPDRGVRSVICTPPRGGLIELVTAEDTSKEFAAEIDRFIATRREGMYAIILGTDDLQTTLDTLATRGMTSAEVPGVDGTFELDPSATFGGRIWVA